MNRPHEIVYWVRARKRVVSVSEIALHFKRSLGEMITEVNRLVEAGELVDQGGSRISAAPRKRERHPDQAPPVQRRIYRAAAYTDMKGKAWSAAHIASLAEASVDYVRDYLAYLAGQGLVRIRRLPGKPNMYRLHPDAPPAGKPPAWVNRRNRELRRKQQMEPGRGA